MIDRAASKVARPRGWSEKNSSGVTVCPLDTGPSCTAWCPRTGGLLLLALDGNGLDRRLVVLDGHPYFENPVA